MITRRQKQTLEFIKSYKTKHGYAPSLEEIKSHLKLSSVSTAHYHVKALEDLGYLHKEENQPRAIEIFQGAQMVKIPLLGAIAAGQPILAVEEKEYIAIPKATIPINGDFYALRVSGESMIDENIYNGDIIIIKSQSTADFGQKIVALIDNSEVTLKKIYKEDDKIRLQPANSRIEPILIEPERLIIQGVVVDIIKQLDKDPVLSLEKATNKEIQQKLNSKKDLEKYINTVVEGDCLEVMKNFPDKSIDMILCDLPYGTTQNQWDSVIPLDQLWKHYERVIKDDGVIALTAQGLFSAKLMLSNPKLFKYKITWVKSKPTNFLNAKKQPLRKHEDVLIFYKKQPQYFPQMSKGEPYNKGYRKDQLTGSYGDFRTVEVKSDGQRYPTDVVYFKTAESEGQVYHPTQKPVELGRYLVRTFTKSGEIVLDNTCGSGSFLVSSILEGRKFIGIEKNQEVYMFKDKRIDLIELCNGRVKRAQES